MNQRNSTFRAVCFRKISFDLNITAAIQIVTKKPVSPCKKLKHQYFERKPKKNGKECLHAKESHNGDKWYHISHNGWNSDDEETSWPF